MASVDAGDRVRVFVGTWVRGGSFPAGDPVRAKRTYVVQVQRVVKQAGCLDVVEWCVGGRTFWCLAPDVRPLLKPEAAKG
jgi:hypothetical protein